MVMPFLILKNVVSLLLKWNFWLTIKDERGLMADGDA